MNFQVDGFYGVRIAKDIDYPTLWTSGFDGHNYRRKSYWGMDLGRLSFKNSTPDKGYER